MGFWASALGVLAPLTAHAGVAEVFYERAVMAAADQRCRLFTPEISAALNAGRAQARGAALRSGIEADVLSKVESRAHDKAYAASCTSPDIATAAGRIRAAYEPFSRQLRQVYPGDFASWTAERTTAQRAPVWTLSQPVSFGWDRMTFGMAGQGPAQALLAVASFADGARPYTARLVIRDTARSPRPYLDARRADAKGRLPLAARITPRVYTRSFMAEHSQPADGGLAPAGTKNAIAYRFPANAATALANLDPREAVEVEFVFQGAQGDVVRWAYVEVGDFAAGQAFLSLAQR
ncbi:hypothetical protein BH11PSE2_BH11PSE2_06120 [soil metagenome]